MMKPMFFATAAEFRSWLEHHHDNTEELWVGFYKIGSGKPSMTWPQAVDESLGFGWIDGQRQGIDSMSYAIWWVVSAKKDETKRKRLGDLIEDSERNRTLPPLTRRTRPE